MKNKLLICCGTRPEWIKIQPIVKKLQSGKHPFELLHTGQHTSLLSGVPATRILDIINGPNRLDSIVQSVLNNENIFTGITHVMVQGDTTSAFALALAAFHRNIPVIHLEAGLRTYDVNNPWPEEINRRCISSFTSIHLCPTTNNKKQLTNEGIGGAMWVVGNTGLDNLIHLLDKIEYKNEVLITLHRRENHHNMDRWFVELSKLAKENPHLLFTFPIHPNPNVQRHKHLLQNINVIDPLGYDDMLNKIVKCRLIISDSGGIQEEASFLKKKVIVCRKTTERPESLNETSFLCGDPEELKEVFDFIISNGYIVSDKCICPYGDGHASETIMKILFLEGVYEDV